MKLIELHVLQSFPVSCLNRDDVHQTGWMQQYDVASASHHVARTTALGWIEGE
jgi:hypothetical protein